MIGSDFYKVRVRTSIKSGLSISSEFVFYRIPTYYLVRFLPSSLAAHTPLLKTDALTPALHPWAVFFFFFNTPFALGSETRNTVSVTSLFSNPKTGYLELNQCGAPFAAGVTYAQTISLATLSSAAL